MGLCVRTLVLHYCTLVRTVEEAPILRVPSRWARHRQHWHGPHRNEYVDRVLP